MFQKITFVLAASFALAGCNLWSGVDTPTAQKEVISAARALMDQGDCQGALNVLNSAPTHDYQWTRLNGWAKLCLGGATANSITASLVGFSGSASGLGVMGTLANSIVKTAQTNKISASQAQNYVAEAQYYFQTAVPGTPGEAADAIIDAELSMIVNAAAMIGMATTDGISVHKADISPLACAADALPTVNACATSVNCTAVNFSDAQTDQFLTQITTANAYIGNSQLGSIGSIASTMAGLGLSTGSPVRCLIYNNMLAN